jgi:hypothetical protein
MQNVVCCEHTRVRCVAITWARCTRVAAVKAPEDRVHTFFFSATLLCGPKPFLFLGCANGIFNPD